MLETINLTLKMFKNHNVTVFVYIISRLVSTTVVTFAFLVAIKYIFDTGIFVIVIVMILKFTPMMFKTYDLQLYKASKKYVKITKMHSPIHNI